MAYAFRRQNKGTPSFTGMYMSTSRGCGQLHLLACEGLERDLLHANSVPSRRHR